MTKNDIVRKEEFFTTNHTNTHELYVRSLSLFVLDSESTKGTGSW